MSWVGSLHVLYLNYQYTCIQVERYSYQVFGSMCVNNGFLAGCSNQNTTLWGSASTLEGPTTNSVRCLFALISTLYNLLDLDYQPLYMCLTLYWHECGINFFVRSQVLLAKKNRSTEGSVSEKVEVIECKKGNPYASMFNSGNLLCLSIF